MSKDKEFQMDFVSYGEHNGLNLEQMAKLKEAVSKYFNKDVLLKRAYRYNVSSSYTIKLYLTDLLGFEIPDLAVKETMKELGIPNVPFFSNVMSYPLPMRFMKILIKDAGEIRDARRGY